MHTTALSPWQHSHQFDSGNPPAEANTWRVVALTAAMMLVELAAGWAFNSMALLADGWHMSTHVAALGLTAAAYVFSRRWTTDPRFVFGTWKVQVLAGFASAVVLGMVALFMVAESVQRLYHPLAIRYDQALAVAVVGLSVNLVSAWLLRGHEPGPAGADGQHQAHDLNLRAAYLHVVADATTSVLAVIALLGGRLLGWAWLDPVMGLAGAAVITVWAQGLVRATSRVLLDREMDHPLVGRVRQALEEDGDTRVSDLHLWRVGRERFACIAAVVTSTPRPPDHYRTLLQRHPQLVHVTVEVNHRASAIEQHGVLP
jgi:cation diffusion facilitator family transporter